MKPIDKFFKTILWSAVFLLAFREGAHAGSAYSRYGYGLLFLRDGVKAIGMGGAGLALSDSVTIFYLNPAALASVRSTHIQGAAIYERASLTLSGNSARFHDVNVNGLGILIPLKRGSALAFGLQPYSQVNYELSQSDSVDGKAFEQSLNGSGGLDAFYLALATTFGPVQIGVTSDFYFGLVRETWRVNFDADDFNYTADRVETNFRGFGVHGGLQFRLKNLQAGLAAGSPVNISGETRIDTRSNNDEVEVPKPAESKLPLWYGLGLAYRATPHWLFSAEGRTQRWGSVNSSDLLGAQGVDSYNLGFGFEFSPGKDRLREGRGMHYRAGANLSRLPYREANGNTIPEWTVAAGLGVPFNRGFSRVDLALEWGKRGNGDNFLQENILRISASINGSERWFQRRR